MKLGIGKFLYRKLDKIMEFVGLAIIDKDVGNAIDSTEGTKFTNGKNFSCVSLVIQINGGDKSYLMVDELSL